MTKRSTTFLLAAGTVVLAAGLGYWAVNADEPATTNAPSTNTEVSSVKHRSFFMDRKFFDDCYDRATAVVPPTGTVIAGIVPHHLLACSLISQWFDGVAVPSPSVVVIVGPNHFGTGRSAVITSAATWATPYGDLPPANDIISFLTKNETAIIDERVFVSEHSISGIVPFIRRSFPEATVVPIVLKDRLPREASEALGRLLHERLPDDALVIASLDFSHDVDSDTADQYDRESIPVLLAMDPDRLHEVHVDSVPTLTALFTYLSLRGANGQLVNNSNAAKVTGLPDLEGVTSYITVYYNEQ